MISLFQKQGVAQKAGQDETGTESHMQASDDFNAHFPMGRQGSGMYKTPRAQGRAGLGSSEPGPLGQGMYSRAALHTHGRHLLLVAVGVEAGHVIVYHLHLLPREVGVLIQGDLMLLAVLWMGSGGVGVWVRAPRVPWSWDQHAPPAAVCPRPLPLKCRCHWPATVVILLGYLHVALTQLLLWGVLDSEMAFFPPTASTPLFKNKW